MQDTNNDTEEDNDVWENEGFWSFVQTSCLAAKVQNARKSQDCGVPVENVADMLRQIKAHAVGFYNAFEEKSDAEDECGTKEDSYRGSENAAENYVFKEHYEAQDTASGESDVSAHIVVDQKASELFEKHESNQRTEQRDVSELIAGGSVRHPNAKMYRAWEDPTSPSFEFLPALILDLNGVLLTTVDCRYAQTPPYWNMLQVVDMGGNKLLGEKCDAQRFVEWCFQHFDVFIWTCANKVNANRILRCFMPFHVHKFKGVLTQESCTMETKFERITRKPVFYKTLTTFWEAYPQYSPANTIMVDDSEYKTLWNPQGTACIVKKMEDQDPGEMQAYLTTILKGWLDAWLGVEDRILYTINTPLPIMKDDDSIAVRRRWMCDHVDKV